MYTDEQFKECQNKYSHNKPEFKEAYHYRNVFDMLFGKYVSNVIPYKWLPRWCGDIKDPSATVLDVYQKIHSDNNQKYIETS